MLKESNRIKWKEYALLFTGIVYLFIFDDLYFANIFISIETAESIIIELSEYNFFTYIFGFNLVLALLLIWQAFYIKYPIAKIVLLLILFVYGSKNIWMLLLQLSMGGRSLF